MPHKTSSSPPAIAGFPFRLGTTSYIVPDDILPNLRHLQGRVDDVELVLFESDDVSNLPSPADVGEMARLAQDGGLSTTVHLPLDTWLGSADETERRRSVDKCLRVLELMNPLQPFAWILHLHGDHRGDPPTADVARWTHQNRRSLAELTAGGFDPAMVCVETLDYDFERVAGAVRDFDLSVCLDIGHLLVNHRNVSAHLNRWLSRTRVVHLHGVREDGRDHVDIGHLPPGLLVDLAHRLAHRPEEPVRVVTLEVFGEDDFERSMAVLQRTLGQWNGKGCTG